MKKNIVILLGFVLFGALAAPLAAQSGYVPAPANLQARQWFQDAKFGLFIHWGVYSVRGRAEWVLYTDKIP